MCGEMYRAELLRSAARQEQLPDQLYELLLLAPLPLQLGLQLGIQLGLQLQLVDGERWCGSWAAGSRVEDQLPGAGGSPDVHQGSQSRQGSQGSQGSRGPW